MKTAATVVWKTRQGALPPRFFTHEPAQAAFFAKLVQDQVIPIGQIEQLEVKSGVALTQSMNLLRFTIRGRQAGRRVAEVVRGKRMAPEVFKLMRQLSDQEPPLLVPQHFFYDPRRQYTLYRELPGQTVRQLERSAQFWGKHSADIGTFLARLHRLSPRFLPARTADQERDFLQSRVRLLRADAALPRTWEDRAARLAKTLNDRHAVRPVALTHGDFQASNILFDATTKQIGAIDFSSASRFHPAADVGWFLIHTNLMLRYHFRQSTIDPWLTAFFRGYSRTSTPANVRAVVAMLPAYLERTLVDIATVSINSFKTPGPERDTIFRHLDELLTVEYAGRAKISIPSL